MLMFQGVFISKIAEGGTAERDGRLQVGDKVLSVRTRTKYMELRARTNAPTARAVETLAEM